MQLKSRLQLYEKQVREYKQRQSQFLQDVTKHNSSIDVLQQRYESGDSEAVQIAVRQALLASQLPERCENIVDVTFDSGLLRVVRKLPDFDDMPSLKGVKVVKKDASLKEVPLTDAARKRIFDSVVYQLMLRTAHEALVGDRAGHADKVEVSGVDDGYDPATGHPARLVLARLCVDRATFERLRLENVDPAVCFKELKGKTKTRPANLRPLDVLDLYAGT